MTKASVNLQDLRRRIFVKAKAEKSWRFWGLYVHVCKMETLREAYTLAKENDGAPGVDGVTFEAIETQGVDGFLEQIRDELNQRTYAALGAGPQPQGLRLEAVEYVMAVRTSAAVQWLQGSVANAESRSSTIGPITLEVKQTGERSAGNPHAAFDVAGAGNVARAR